MTWYAVTVAVTFQLVAGVLHLVLTPTHLVEALGTGLFFVAIGAGQTLWAVAVLRGRFRWQAESGIILAVVPLVLYVVTRILQNPFTGEPESVDAIGILTTMAEAIVLVALAGTMLADRITSSVSSRVGRTAMSLLVGVAFAGAIYGVAFVALAILPGLGDGSTGHEHAEGSGHAIANNPLWLDSDAVSCQDSPGGSDVPNCRAGIPGWHVPIPSSRPALGGTPVPRP